MKGLPGILAQENCGKCAPLKFFLKRGGVISQPEKRVEAEQREHLVVRSRRGQSLLNEDSFSCPFGLKQSVRLECQAAVEIESSGEYTRVWQDE